MLSTLIVLIAFYLKLKTKILSFKRQTFALLGVMAATRFILIYVSQVLTISCLVQPMYVTLLKLGQWTKVV